MHFHSLKVEQSTIQKNHKNVFECICEIFFEHYSISFLKYEYCNCFIERDVLQNFSIFDDVFVDRNVSEIRKIVNTSSFVVMFENQTQERANVILKKRKEHSIHSTNNELFVEICNEYIEDFVDRTMIFENVKFLNFDIFDVRVSFNNVKQFQNKMLIEMF